MYKKIVFLLAICFAYSFANAQSGAKEFKPSVEQTTVKQFQYLAVHDSGDVKNIGTKLGYCYGQIMEVMGKENLKQSGPVFAIYFSESATNFDFDAAIPVSGKMTDMNNVKAKVMSETKAVVVHYYGPYEGTPAGHEMASKYIMENKLDMTGLVWEEYVTDPGVEKDQAKWLTNIYYSIK
jgi:effector-binding domain-containing protein